MIYKTLGPPLNVTLLNNELFVLENDENSRLKAAYKIVSINGISSNQIIEKLIKNISRDGECFTGSRNRIDCINLISSVVFIMRNIII